MLDPSVLTLVITSALIDALNPWAIGILVLLIAVILGSGASARRLVAAAGAYIVAILATYFAAGLGLVFFFSALPPLYADYLSYAVGVLIVAAGVLEIKEYFWPGVGPSLRIPRSAALKIQKWPAHKMNVVWMLTLGVFVAIIELLCTGAPYLATIAALRATIGTQAVPLLLLYSLLYVLPMVAIVGLVASGIKISAVHRLHAQTKALIRLLAGLILVCAGWIILLITNGVIHFG